MFKKYTTKVLLIIMIIIANFIILTITTLSVLKSAKRVIENDGKTTKKEDIISADTEGENIGDNLEYEYDNIDNNNDNNDNSQDFFDLIKSVSINSSDIIKILLIIVGFNLIILSVTILFKIKKILV